MKALQDDVSKEEDTGSIEYYIVQKMKKYNRSKWEAKNNLIIMTILRAINEGNTRFSDIYKGIIQRSKDSGRKERYVFFS
jgi:ribosomal protein L14